MSELFNFAVRDKDNQNLLLPASSVRSTVTITVFDQFGERLAPIYDGVGVVTEAFSHREGKFREAPECEEVAFNAGPPERCQNGPPSLLRIGEIEDEVCSRRELSRAAGVRPLRIPLVPLWVNEMLRLSHPRAVPGGATNAWALLRVEGFEGSTVQTIRVHGFVVFPNFHGIQKALHQNAPPPLLVRDVPFPATGCE